MTENKMQTRHSTRKFADKPIDASILENILTTAQHAPSWENSQPWKVYVASGKTAKAIRQQHQKSVAAGDRSRAEIKSPKQWDARSQANIDDWQRQAADYFSSDPSQVRTINTELFDAPTIVYLTAPKDATAYSLYDLGAYGYGVVLAAEAQGIGSISAYELVRYPEEVRAQFDISDDENLVMGIGLGYPVDDRVNQYEPGRLDLNHVVEFRD